MFTRVERKPANCECFIEETTVYYSWYNDVGEWLAFVFLLPIAAPIAWVGLIVVAPFSWIVNRFVRGDIRRYDSKQKVVRIENVQVT